MTYLSGEIYLLMATKESCPCAVISLYPLLNFEECRICNHHIECLKDVRDQLECIRDGLVELRLRENMAEGDRCPVCSGEMVYPPPMNCSCHLGHPPCSACTEGELVCSHCGSTVEDLLNG